MSWNTKIYLSSSPSWLMSIAMIRCSPQCWRNMTHFWLNGTVFAILDEGVRLKCLMPCYVKFYPLRMTNFPKNHSVIRWFHMNQYSKLELISYYCFWDMVQKYGPTDGATDWKQKYLDYANWHLHSLFHICSGDLKLKHAISFTNILNLKN